MARQCDHHDCGRCLGCGACGHQSAHYPSCKIHGYDMSAPQKPSLEQYGPTHLGLKCPRCGETHGIKFRKLANPSGKHTHAGICEKTGDPVLMYFEKVTHTRLA